MLWTAVEGRDDALVNPVPGVYACIDVAVKLLRKRPEYADSLGEISTEWNGPRTEVELWWLPYDHSPTRFTEVTIREAV
jgi:hypothetical protein